MIPQVTDGLIDCLLALIGRRLLPSQLPTADTDWQLDTLKLIGFGGNAKRWLAEVLPLVTGSYQNCAGSEVIMGFIILLKK